MKSLFVKQKYCYGGPWFSFNFSEVTPLDILEYTLAKGGHPFPLIMLMEMDCKIISEEVRQPWMDMAEGQHPTMRQLLNEHTKGEVSVNSIDFSKYEGESEISNDNYLEYSNI